MGKALVAVGIVWLVAVSVAVFSARSGFDFAVSFPNGTSQRQVHLVLFATIAVLGLGWLIPLSAGMLMLVLSVPDNYRGTLARSGVSAARE